MKKRESCKKSLSLSTLSSQINRHDRGRLKRPAREENTREVQRGRYHRGFEKISRGANRNETGENTVRKFVSKFVVVVVVVVVVVFSSSRSSLKSVQSITSIFLYARTYTSDA